MKLQDKTAFRAWVVLLAALLLSGCTLHTANSPSFENGVPEAFTQGGSATQVVRWWEDFQDPDLSATIETVIEKNPELLKAWARLEQSHELAVQAGAALWPQVDFDAGAQRSRSNVSTSKSRKDTEAARSNQHFMSVGLSYEIDLWGRIRSLRDAARTDVKASLEDLNATAIHLASQTADTWFSIIEKKSTLKLLEEQLALNRTYLRLNQERFAQGLGSALDVYQQEQVTARTRARIPQVAMQVEILENALSVLRGDFPGTDMPQAGVAFPQMPAFPDTGLPADLLERRPDVMAARLRVAAADHRVAQAMAERLPALRIGGTYGYRAAEPAWLLENMIWDIFANLSVTLLDGGRKASEVKRQQAVVKERLAGYVSSGIQAVTEVEDAISRERHQREYLDRLDEQISASRSSLRQARLRYAAGLTEYLPVLAALQSLQDLQVVKIASYRELYAYRVQLYKSLGGGWLFPGGDGIASNLPAQPETTGKSP